MAEFWIDGMRRFLYLRPSRWLSDYGIIQSTVLTEENVRAEIF